MINGRQVLAVIPARGGSKGIPLKNLKKINGIPLVEMASKIASSIELIDRIVVSTDHNKIANSAIKGGASAPFMRPEKLSGDRISDLEVLTHALLEMEKKDNQIYDIILMLQPTSPMRTIKNIINVLDMLVSNDYDAVWTVSETDSKSHPLKQLKVKSNKLSYYDESGKDIIARQQLDPVYHRNGIAYAIIRECLLENKSIMGENTGALICDGINISIDTERDLFLAEYEINKKN
jgi:CMP-N,N'-diacetyllegionaminic acid synthase